MNKELSCTIASAGNCSHYKLDSTPQGFLNTYTLIEFNGGKYSCKVCRGKDFQGTEIDCIEIEKLNLLSKLVNK
jgi:hypothetical protein